MSVSKSSTRRYDGAITVTSEAVNNWNPSLTYTRGFSRSIAAVSSATYGDSVKDWRKRIARNQSATTTLVGTRFRVRTLASGRIEVYQNIQTPYGVIKIFDGDLYLQSMAFPSTSTSMDADADVKARSKFLKNYMKIKNSWRGGNFLAEIRESYQLVRHPLESFYKSSWELARELSSIRRSRRVYRLGRVAFNDRVSNAWLAWTFGVKPLVSDLNDAVDSFNTIVHGTGVEDKVDRSDGIPITAFGRNTVQDSPSIFDWNPPPGESSYGVKYERVIKRDLTVRYHGKVCATPMGIGALLERFGVSVFDVLPAVWEAIPWSFLVDYFANVAEQLDAIRLVNAEVKWLNRTIRNSTTINFSSPIVPASTASISVYGRGGRFYALATGVNRDAVGAVPYPSWRFSIPGIESSRWLNVGALANLFASSKWS